MQAQKQTSEAGAWRMFIRCVIAAVVLSIVLIVAFAAVSAGGPLHHLIDPDRSRSTPENQHDAAVSSASRPAP